MFNDAKQVIAADERCPFINATTMNDLFAHSYVQRYHTENTRPQKLAEHCFRVTLVAVKMLYAYYDWLTARGVQPPTSIKEVELQIYRYGLLHEASELDFGDVPSHVKNKILEQHGVDWNAIAESEHWTSRGLDFIPEPAPLVKALVSLADTLEGRLLAYHHIPEGGVRDGVLRDWAAIWNRKTAKFLGSALHADYKLELGKYYSSNLHVDKAWV